MTLSLNTVKSRFTAASLDLEFAERVYVQMRYAERVGQDPEDLLQEAILAGLAGEKIMSAVYRLGKEKFHEINAEGMISDGADREYFYEIFEKKSVDSERPDWIPDDPAAKASLVQSCLKAIQRTYRPIRKQPKGYQAYLKLQGRSQFIGVYKTDADRALAERASLEKIISWCASEQLLRKEPTA